MISFYLFIYLFIFVNSFVNSFLYSFISFWVNKLMTINDKMSTCKLVFFSHFRINATKMQVHDNTDFSITVELTLAHFTTLKGG